VGVSTPIGPYRVCGVDPALPFTKPNIILSSVWLSFFLYMAKADRMLTAPKHQIMFLFREIFPFIQEGCSF
jgi:hypothetical protein